jgi:hypothetical protein
MAAKTYYSKTAMGRFPFSNGGEALFIYGRYTTSNEREQAELDAIIPPLGNNPNIYTLDHLQIEGLPPVQQNAQAGASVAAADRALMAGTQNIRMQEETPGPVIINSDINTSTIDPSLRESAFGQVTPLATPPRVVGPGAAAVQPPQVIVPPTTHPEVVNPGGTKFMQNAAEHQGGGVEHTTETLEQLRAAAAARTQQMLDQGNQNQGS